MNEVLDILETTEEDKLQMLIASLEAGEETLSYSSIKQFMRSPRDFIRYKLRQFEPTEAMIEGTLCDMLLTEPDKVDRKFGVIPAECSKATKAGVAAYCEFLGISGDFAWKDRGAVIDAALAAQGKHWVSSETMELCEAMTKAVKFNSSSRWILEATEEFQAPVNFTEFGWEWKGMKDLYTPGLFTADLKKTKDANPRKFKFQIRDLAYDLQGAIYTIGHGDKVPYFIIAYDKSCGVSVTEFSGAVLQQTWDNLARVMDKFNECVIMNKWHQSFDFWAGTDYGIYQY